MEYFCYISESKVNSLLQQIDDHVIDSVNEETLIEKTKSANPSLGEILRLFSIGISFGKKDRVVISKAKSEALVQKLRRVISFLALKHNLTDLHGALTTLNRLDDLFYSFTGKFNVVKYDENYAHLQSNITESISLLLICSLKYFSDVGVRDGNYTPHSGNYMFFSGRINPTFKTVVVIQDYRERQIIGSPLFLALEPIGKLHI